MMKFEKGQIVTVGLFGLGRGQIIEINGDKAIIKFYKRPGIDINGGVNPWTVDIKHLQSFEHALEEDLVVPDKRVDEKDKNPLSCFRTIENNKKSTFTDIEKLDGVTAKEITTAKGCLLNPYVPISIEKSQDEDTKSVSSPLPRDEEVKVQYDTDLTQVINETVQVTDEMNWQDDISFLYKKMTYEEAKKKQMAMLADTRGLLYGIPAIPARHSGELLNVQPMSTRESPIFCIKPIYDRNQDKDWRIGDKLWHSYFGFAEIADVGINKKVVMLLRNGNGSCFLGPGELYMDYESLVYSSWKNLSWHRYVPQVIEKVVDEEHDKVRIRMERDTRQIRWEYSVAAAREAVAHGLDIEQEMMEAAVAQMLCDGRNK